MNTIDEKIKKKETIIGIVGLGYVGLPLALQFCEQGFKTIGFDILKSKVASINAGNSPIIDIDEKILKNFVEKGQLFATSDFSEIKKSNIDAIIICVPTPLNKTKDPDVSFIIKAAKEIKKYLRKGQIVVLESTTYPGFTREALLPILEESGLKAGIDFHLAFSPERIDPANRTHTVKNTPKVVGGLSPSCTRVVSQLYSAIIDRVFPVSSADAAEMAKLLENTFRAVNIGLVNELSIMCRKLKINTWEVIEAASTKPFGYMPFYPGPGLGGHCIPIDPLYLSWKMKSLKYQARFIELADAINTNMPFHVVNLVSDVLNKNGKCFKGSNILILGVAYKKYVDDVRESPALDVMELIMEKGANVYYHDPYIQQIIINDKIEAHSVDIVGDNFFQKSFKSNKSQIANCKYKIKDYDCIVIITDHSCYNYDYIVQEAKLIVDTRNATRNVEDRKNIYLL